MNEAELFGGEDMLANREVIIVAVDELKGEHGGSPELYMIVGKNDCISEQTHRI